MANAIEVQQSEARAAILAENVVAAGVYTEEYYLTDAEGKEEYIETGGDELSPRLARTWSLAGVKPGMKILDLGFGRGEVVYRCALKGAEVAGVDYSDAAIRLARRLIDKLPPSSRNRATLYHADMRKLPFDDNYFDLIFMLDIVEHLSPHELDSVMSEVHRVLKKGGKCILHTMPNRLYWDVGYRFYMKWADALIKLMLKCKFVVRHEGRNHFSLRVHVNEQTLWGLRRNLDCHGLKGRVWLEDDFFHRKNFKRCSWTELVYEAIMRLWPISNLWPLKYVFHHTLYAVVEKQGHTACPLY